MTIKVFEYKVRRTQGGGTGDVGRICNEMAKVGWRFVSTTGAPASDVAQEPGGFMFFKREMPAIKEHLASPHGTDAAFSAVVERPETHAAL